MRRLGLGLLVTLAATATAVFFLGGTRATAEQTVNVDSASLESLQASCRDEDLPGLSSARLLLVGTPPVMPDLTVEIDTDADNDLDRTVTVAPDVASTPGAVRYTLNPSGFIIDASAVLPDAWEGTLTLSQAQCDNGPPPADACEEFPGRAIFRLDQRLGDPKNGLVSIAEIPQGLIGDGIYDVTLKSFDEHSVHGGQGQEEEAWSVLFPVRLSFVETEPIDDLPDNQDTLNQKVGQIRLESDPSHIVLMHVNHTNGGQLDQFRTPESITAVCVALDRVGNVPAVPGAPE